MRVLGRPDRLTGTAPPAPAAVPGPVERRRPGWRLLHEALVLGGLWLVYSLGRALAGRHTGGARAHSSDVWALERALHLPAEDAVQRAVLGRETLVHAANAYYEYEHFTSLGLAALWLLLVHPDRYPWFRRVLVATTGLALVGHLAYPLTPPRLRPDLGLVDTGVRYGQSVYGADAHNSGLLDQYAAMPSMHVAWAFLFALAVLLVARSRWRWVAVAYPALTTYVVVVTGNHYWLDGVVGVLLLCLALATVGRLRPGARAGPSPAAG